VGFARLRRLPQGEVQRVALALVGGDARTDLELVDVAPRQLAVALEGPHGEVHVAVHDIRVPALDKSLHHRDHLRDGLGRPWLGTRALDAQVGHGLQKSVSVSAGHLGRLDALLVRRLDDLVVDVRDVLDEADIVAAVLEVAADHVEAQECARVADVDVVVDGRAAHVHEGLALLARDEVLFGADHRVVQAECHVEQASSRWELEIAGRVGVSRYRDRTGTSLGDRR
jgi:hypothetical protein